MRQKLSLSVATLKRASLIGIAFLIFSARASQEPIRVCGQVYALEGELPLNSNEKIMVCGSPSGLEGWREVPLPQAEYQIRVLLQRRGYLRPRFEREKNRLLVWIGPRQIIKKFSVEGASGWLHPEKKRKVLGQAMSSEVLDEISTWAVAGLREQGFPCAKADVSAHAWDGEVIVKVEPGLRARVHRISMDLEGLESQALTRHLAVRTGDWFDVRDKELTVRRMLAEGLFQTASLSEVCRGDSVDLTLHASAGPAQMLRFSLGASTEELPFADLSYKSSKLDRRASSFTSSLHASPREQSLNLSGELYWLPLTATSYLGPRLRVERESELDWEDLLGRAGVDLGVQGDLWSVRWSGRAGPTLNYVNTLRGLGPDDVSYLSWEGEVSLMSHAFELGLRNQYEGWTVALDYLGQRDGLGSPLNADRLDLDGKYFWNLGALDPPLLVLATRVQASGALANAPTDLVEDTKSLPREYRIFLGGDDNLRGWTRKSLDNRGRGYLSALYAGFELRLIEELPYKIQPLFLWDVAKLGERSLTLDPPLFSDFGFGLRWVSPFGTLRGSASRGQILNAQASSDLYPEAWVYFLSFGQEF